MKLNLLALALPLALSTAVYADSSTPQSQFQYQTDAGKWNVTPDFTFGSIETKFNTADSGGEDHLMDNLFNVSVAGEYGISDMVSVGLKLGYQSDSFAMSPSENAPTASGMVDPDLFVKGRNYFGNSSIRWGANLSFSLGNATENTADTKENESSGGITLTPFVGYELYNIAQGTLGARLSYDVLQTNRTLAYAGTTEKIEDGNDLDFTVFYELNWDPVIWGFDAGLINHQGSKLNSNGTTTSMQDSQTDWKIETYAAWTVCPDITVLPSIAYGPLGSAIYDIGLNGATSQEGIYGSIAARFTF